MKIHSVRFENLNSLVGLTEIDFTRDVFSDEGIFLITGPTGAGKTTILDAICLALYGMTPRLEDFSSKNIEIMSKSCKNCFAEVVFESRGALYSSRWSHEKKFGKRGGCLEKTDYKLVDLNTGHTLCDRISDLKEKKTKALSQEESGPAKYIGLTFSQFTRTMLLAQGNFSAFLKAKQGERIQLLEKMTGTEIYKLISTNLYRLVGEKQKSLEMKKGILKNLAESVLDDAGEQVQRQLLADCEARIKELEKLCAAQNTAINWLQMIEQLEKELAGLKEQEKRLLEEEQNFASQKLILERAKEACAIEVPYENYRAARQRRAEAGAALQKLQASLPVLEKKGQDAQKALESAIVKREKISKDYNEAQIRLNGARDLDSQIDGLRKDVNGKKQKLSEAKAKCGEYEKQVANTNGQLEKTEASLVEAATWLKGRESWEGLDKLVAILMERDRQASDLLEKLRNIQQKRNEAAQNLAIKNNAVAAQTRALANLAKENEELAAKISGFEEEIAAISQGKSQDGLQARFHELLVERNKIESKQQNVIEMRAKLANGMPCPVCGALHHPYAEDSSLPEPTEFSSSTDVEELDRELEVARQAIVKVNDIRGRIVDLQKRQSDVKDAFHKRENALVEAKAELNGVEDSIRQLDQEAEETRAQIADQKESARRLLSEHGVPVGRDFNLGEVCGGLRARDEQWRKRNKEKNDAELNINILKTRLEGERNTLQNQMRLADEAALELADEQNRHGELVERRRKEFGDITREGVEALANSCETAEKTERNARDNADAAAREFEKSRGQAKLLEEQSHVLEREFEARQQEFQKGLAERGFADEKAFVAARQPREVLEGIHKREENLRDRKADLDGAMKRCQEKLAIEKGKNLTDMPLVKLSEKNEADKIELSRKNQEQGQITGRLETNESIRGEVARLTAECGEREVELADYIMLNKLIGSENGEKFQKFAQTLTLEILLEHANAHLKKLTDRYQLVRDKNEPLEFNIQDGHQGNELRPTATLSGGESFIVSLALALGLSSMCSEKTTIDSLFLDEGFGTLDEKTLDSALAVLKNLKREGKLIGIISHVASLRESIATKIDVIPRGNGKSRVVIS